MDRSRLSHGWFLVRMLGFLALASCGGRSVDTPTESGCPASGQEKFSIHLDGVYSGLFETLKDPSPDHPGVAVFQNGVIFRGRFVKAWIRMQTQSPPPRLPETHDATVFSVENDIPSRRLKTFTETDVLSLDAEPYQGDDSCLLVKKLELKVKKTVKYRHADPAHQNTR